MQALVLNGDYDISVQERPRPRPGPADVLINVIATGICGSDVHGYSGENGRRHPGQIMGHETVGRIAETGAHVTSHQVGELVTAFPILSCGTCQACRAGNQQWCATKQVLGVSPEISAAFADQMVVPAANVVTLPADLPAEHGALVEPLSVGYHAIRRGGCEPDDGVLVLGGGPIGQACLLAAQRLGVSEVVVSDPQATRREICAQLGAAVVDPAAGTLDDMVTAVLDERPSLVVDAVGLSATLGDALQTARLGARIVLVGMGSPQLDLSAYPISTQERSLIGSFTYTAGEFADTAAWVGAQPPGLERLIDGHVGWEQAAQSFDDLARGVSTASKIMVYPQGPPQMTGPTAGAMR